MTHQEFAQEVLKEWNIQPGQMNQSCWCQWYHYTIPNPNAEIAKSRIIGEYTARDGKDVFVLYRQDGTEQAWEADK